MKIRKFLVGLAGAGLLMGLAPAVPAQAAVPSLPASVKSCTGVWVVVDRGYGDHTVRCATKYDNGVAALKSAGLKVTTYDSSFGPAVCQIAGYPSTCDKTFSLGYWAYYGSTLKTDGTWADWTYAQEGAGSSTPKPGVAEGWRWTPAEIPYTSKYDPSVKPRAAYTAAPVPTVTGTAKVGKKLTVATGTWAPSPSKLTIKWYRGSTLIKRAENKKTLTLTKLEKGKKIRAKVTASGAGLQTVTTVSLPTAKVAKK
jgi:hypothetical protein